MMGRFARILLAASLVTAVGMVFAGCGGTNLQADSATTQEPVAQPVTITVNLLGNRFDTQEVTIPAGSTIIFHNTTSADHGIISSVFDADLRPGQDYQYTFNTPGTYEVRSRTHVAATGIYLRVVVE